MDLHGLESLRSLNPHAHSPQDHQHSLHDPQLSTHSHSGLYHVPHPSHLQGSLPSHHPFPHHLQPHHQALHDPYGGYSPYDVDPLEQHIPLSHDHLPHAHPSSTYVPGLIPPGMDPGQVDMRTFYPYQPNEVKHRKRTTRSQLKVLEDVYKYDTKPNATLRKKLAEELGMTPRGVQVWFQNRRAKTKSQARKADAVSKKADEGSAVDGAADGAEGSSKTEDAGDSRPSSPTSASSPLPGAVNSGSGDATPATPPHRLSGDSTGSSSGPTATPISPPDNTSGASSSPRTITEASPTTTSQAISSSATSNDVRSESEPAADLSVGIDTSLFGNPFPFGRPPGDSPAGGSPSIPPTPAEQHSMGLGSGLMIPDHLRNQRRPSLPIIVSPPMGDTQNFLGQGLAPHQQQRISHMQSHLDGSLLDPSLRHRTVESNIARLGSHPYAHMVPNSGLTAGQASLLRRGSMPHVLDSQMMSGMGRSSGLLNPQGHGHFIRRPAMFSRQSMPAIMHMQEESAAFEESPPRISQAFNMHNNAGNTLSPYGMRHSSTGNGMFSPPSREIPAPIPGPLPSPGFSFGDAPSSSTTDSSGASSSSPSLATPASASHLLRARRSLSGPAEDPDTEDDASAISSNYPFSRFGSFASVAGSESSFTSGGCWSDTSGAGKQQRGSEGQLHIVENGSGGANGYERRPSASGQMLELFHDLDVNGNHTPQPHSQPLSRSRSGDGNDGHDHEAAVSAAIEGMQMKRGSSSELVYALRANEDAGPTDDPSGLQYAGNYTNAGSDQAQNEHLGHGHGHSDEGQYNYSHDEHQHQPIPKAEYPEAYTLGNADGYPLSHTYTSSPNQNALQFQFIGGAGAGGPGPYQHGAIELSNVCVPAMDYHTASPYMQYS